MQNRDQIERYLDNKDWDKAYEWIQKERGLLGKKLTRNRMVYHSFGIPMSVILAFFTWVVLFPSADEKELAAFPLVTICHDYYMQLCETVPGGKTAVIVGLLLIPFLLSLVMLLLSLCFRPRKYKAVSGGASAVDVQKKLELLFNTHSKYRSGMIPIMGYAFVTIALTGVVMVFSSVPGGLNPFEYLFVGVICGGVQFLAFMLCGWVYNFFFEIKPVPSYSYFWKSKVDLEIDHASGKATSSSYSSGSGSGSSYYQSKFDEYYAQYTGTPYESDEEWAARIVRDVEDDLSGGGWGNY